MTVGAITKSFGGTSVRQTAEIFSLAGLSCAELCFCQTDLPGWKYNFSGYEPLPDISDTARAVKTFSEYGINVCAIGVYNCLWAGNAVKIADSLKYFCEYCDAASEVGVRLLTTHTGTPGLWYAHTAQDSLLAGKAYEYMTYALAEAHKRGISVAVECTASDAIKSYDGFLELKSYVKKVLGTSSMLKYTEVPMQDKDTVLHPETALLHIRDRKSTGKFYERLGDGDTDFAPFFASNGIDGSIPIILEYVNSSNLCDTVKRLKSLIP